MVQCRAEMVSDANGRPVRIIGTNLDITDRHRVEEQVREKSDELQALSRRLLEAQEVERRLLARELHDNVGQFLTAIRLSLQAHEARSEHLTESLALVDQAIEQVRNLAVDLRPSVLDDLGLVAALRWLLSRQSQRAGFEGTVAMSSSTSRLPAPIETCCFRLAQEALTNVARHAAARRVLIELGESEDGIEMVVRDDGKGFDVRTARDRAAGGASLGLLSMEERVSLAGGTLEIESVPGEGTTLRARFPVPGRKTP
jgi:signal transduction histidine kinase